MTTKNDYQNQMRTNPVSELADKLGHFLWSEGYGKNCCNCDNWQKAEQICAKFKVLPPAEVIVIGCKHHTDALPF